MESNGIKCTFSEDRWLGTVLAGNAQKREKIKKTWNIKIICKTENSLPENVAIMKNYSWMK